MRMIMIMIMIKQVNQDRGVYLNKFRIDSR